MYQVYCDGIPLHDLRSEKLILNDPVVTVEDNSAGSFEFSISIEHPEYDSIKKLKSVINVLHNGVEIFCGRPTEERMDFYNNKHFHCEGELNYFADSIQRPAEYHDMTVRGFLETLVAIHNAQVVESNIAITFNPQSAGVWRTWDYLYLYYVQNGKVYRVLNKVMANDIAGKTFVVPTMDFYLWWHTDSSVNNFYGFSIDSVEMTGNASNAADEIQSLPNYPVIETLNVSDVQTEHFPYKNSDNKLWHYTHTVPDDYLGHKTFKVGAVTVTDSNDSLYRYTNYESTLNCINEKLIKRLGGHIRIRKVNGIRYIDYLADYPNTNDQVIEFGKNLMDFSQTIDASDIATAIIPLGAKLEESSIAKLDERLTIKSVNNDCDFVYSQSAVANYGWIYKTVTFDNVNVPANLKRKGEEYLSDIQFESLVLDCTAVDLNNLDVNIQRINLLDLIRVISEPHGLDRLFPVTKLTISLDKPENDKVILGREDSKSSSTDSSASNNADIMEKINSIPSESEILKEAIENASALINAATHGHVVTTANEQLIMDTNDTATATKVWRWNLNGLGYSSTGYNGTYASAITMDGQILGDRLVGGSVSTEKLSVQYRSTVERAIELAEENANGSTDSKLQSYYTKTQVTTVIQNTANSVLISAREDAIEYTDNRLKNYSTSAQIKVTTDSIISEVSRKLNSSEFTTKLTQSAYYVRIAWNNISNYIQFEYASLNIYDYSNYLLMSLDSSGCWYYREGTTLGKLGTNSWSGDSSYKGLVFDLEYEANYICWAAKDSRNAGTYTTKLIYYHDSRKAEQGLHFDCKTYAWSNLHINPNNFFVNFNDNRDMGIATSGLIYICNKSYVTGIAMSRSTFTIYNGVSVKFYSNLNMNGYSITNQSDARMKKNIQDTDVNALQLLNSIDLKQFDWIQDGVHEPIGVIAQQLQQFAPELVTEEPDGHLSIKTTQFIPYLIKAIQELSGEGYSKVPWSDPYTLLEKKTFVAGLDKETETVNPVVKEAIKLPIK